MLYRHYRYGFVILAGLLLSMLVLPAIAQRKSPKATRLYYLNYSFEKKDSNTVAVTMQYHLGNAAATRLLLPNSYAGTDSLFKCIKNLRVSSGNAYLKSTERPDSFIVEQKAGKEVVVSYDLEQDWTGEITDKVYFRPIVREDLFFISAYAGLVYPVIPDSLVLKSSVKYKGFEKENVSGNSFYVNASSGSFSATIGQIKNSIFFSGKMRLYESEVNGSKLRLAVYGKFVFSDDSLQYFIKDVINYERRFWNDESQPDFLVTLLPTVNVTGGTAYHNSFTLFGNQRFKLNQGINYLIAHEYMHTWLGGAGLQQQKTEELDKWFIEGFTDYYTYHVLYEIGEYTEKDYVDQVNTVVRAYYASPVAGIHNQQLIGNYFSDENYRILPYYRGHIIAFLLNTIFQEKGLSFDDFIRDFYKSCSGTKLFNADKFYEQLTRKIGLSITEIVKQINSGENSQIVNYFKRVGYRTVLQELQTFELGFDFNESKNAKVIKGLIKGSAAEQAGLSEGSSLSGYYSFGNDPYKLAKIGVKDGDKIKIIEFYPAKKTGVFTPQLVKE